MSHVLQDLSGKNVGRSDRTRKVPHRAVHWSIETLLINEDVTAVGVVWTYRCCHQTVCRPDGAFPRVIHRCPDTDCSRLLASAGTLRSECLHRLCQELLSASVSCRPLGLGLSNVQREMGRSLSLGRAIER